MIRLLNRRFVNFYFDMTEVGVAYDREAREFFRKLDPEQHDIQETLNPHAIFVSPDGEFIDTLHGYSHPDAAVAKILSVLARHPEQARSRAGEAQGSPEQRAEVLIDLMQLGRAAEVLEGVSSDRGRYLRAHAARLRGDFVGFDEDVASLAHGPYAQDGIIERAHRFWHDRQFERMQNSLADYPARHPRHAEARYLVGIALYHQGKKLEAREHWEKMIGSCALSPWVYRADWAHFCTTFEVTKQLSTGDERQMDRFDAYTPLNRHGYGYRHHPDLRLDGYRAPFDELREPTLEHR